MNEPPRITPGTWGHVHYNPACPGGRRPHHPILGLYQGAPCQTAIPPEGGLGIGRYFRPNELEVLTPGASDPPPEDDAERPARLRESMGST